MIEKHGYYPNRFHMLYFWCWTCEDFLFLRKWSQARDDHWNSHLEPVFKQVLEYGYNGVMVQSRMIVPIYESLFTA
jgi:hypothetical protein